MLACAACSGGDPAGADPNGTAMAGTGANVGDGGDGNGGSNGSSGASSLGGASNAAGNNGWPAFAATQAFQLRRLTTTQYLASIKTLLGVDTEALPPIEGVSPVAGFSAVGASSSAVSSAGVGQFEIAARFLVDSAFANGLPAFVPCTPAGVDDAACFTQFVSEFGRRAFRRPLSGDEVSRYSSLATQVATTSADATEGLRAALSAFLQSPNFLYLPEIGEPDPEDASRVRFSNYEMAARLSYFLTNDTPDDELLAAAEAGTLTTLAGIQAQTERLLTSPAAHTMVTTFFDGLLSLDALDTLSRPVEIFPLFTSNLAIAMKQETALVIDDLVFTRDEDYRGLFDQPDTFVNPELAALYGIPAPATAGFERVTLPPSSGRMGLLGHAGVLAVRDHSDATSPTKRGLFVLTRLLCRNLPLLPPANLQIPQPPTGNLTAREKFEQHSADPVCAACHDYTDPVGLSLEHFDALGAYRETDHGLPIDDTGEIDGVTFQGLAGLAAVVRDDPALLPCLTQSLYSVGVGHLSTEFDRTSFSGLVDELASNGGRIRPLIAALVTSEGFRYLP
jgi:hypothetical protein